MEKSFYQVPAAIKMSLPAVMLPILILLFFTENVRAQDTVLERTISFPDSSCNLEGALQLIEKQTGYYFSYNSSLLDEAAIVSLDARELPLREHLKNLITYQEIDFDVIGNQIVIFGTGSPAGNQSPSGRKVITLDIREIWGNVVDLETGRPVPFAAVCLYGKTRGTITNPEGKFVIKLASDEDIDSLVISSLGYRTYYQLIKGTGDEDLQIGLYPDPIPIQEVIVRRTDPHSLIKAAVKNFSLNYFPDPVLMTAFYRESTRKNNRYIIVSEAILKIRKAGFRQSYLNDQIKIIKARKNLDISQGDTVTVKLKAGLRLSMMLDIVQNPPDFLDPELLDNFRFRMRDIVRIGNDYAYMISFVQDELHTEVPHYRGSLYIDVENLAILAADFEISQNTIQQSTNSFIVKKPRRTNIKLKKAEYHVSYSRCGSKYAVHTIRNSMDLSIRKKGKLGSNLFHTSSEMAITEVDTSDTRRLIGRELARDFDIFINQVAGDDPSFWGPYNYIQPDESMEEAIKRINKLISEKPD